jgi:hypothetical protein
VLVEVPGMDSQAEYAVYDAVRDAALSMDAGILRLARRRGQLAELFHGQ